MKMCCHNFTSFVSIINIFVELEKVCCNSDVVDTECPAANSHSGVISERKANLL